MTFHRVFTLIKKDLIWCRTDCKILSILLSGPLVGVFIIFMEFITRTRIPETEQPIQLPDLSFFAIVIVSYLTGTFLTLSLIIYEKTKGTLLALLMTPLKPLEFITGKLFLTFSVTLLFSLICISINIFLNPQMSFLLNPFVFLNLILFISVMCLSGCILGLFAEMEMESRILSAIPVLLFLVPAMLLQGASIPHPSLQKWLDFVPLSHFFKIFQDLNWPVFLFYTGFNLLFLLSFTIFAVFYTKFYFSSGREKRFSLNLFWGLFGLIGLYILSGLITSKVVQLLSYTGPL